MIDSPPHLSIGGDPGPHSPCRILLVEDHADTRKVFTALLERSGYQVTAAGSCAEARQLANGTRYNILIADMGLPDGDGCLLLREIAADKGISLTGYGMPEDQQRSVAAGFKLHLVKPVQLDELERAIKEVMREAN